MFLETYDGLLNNPTEQVIGKMKMRARTVRGYKNWSGMASGLMSAGVGVAWPTDGYQERIPPACFSPKSPTNFGTNTDSNQA